MTTCLVLIDLQNDYFPGGRMQLAGIEAAAANAARLLDHTRRIGSPIIHIQHIAIHTEATFFLPDSEGAAIHRSVAPREDELRIVKHYPNAFRETGLLAALQQRSADELIVCGAMSHMCIDATVRAAVDLGMTCTVAHDACTTTQLAFGGRVVSAADVHASFMAALSGSYARLAATRALTTA